MKSIVLVLLILGSCYAHYTEDCLTLCEDVNPLDEWENEGYAPSLYMLKTLCPKTLEFLDCRTEEMQDCLGQSFGDMAISTNFSIASFSRVILATNTLIRQVCNENSSFHKDYVRNIDCYKAFSYVIRQFCSQDVSRIENLFLGTLKVYPEEDMNCKVKLFSGPYELACMSDMIGRACGPTAKRLHATATLMFKDIFLVDCPHINQNWKEEYLDFLVGNKRREFEEIYNAFFKRF
ncbi:hypothetical protein AVEN_75574-1 [Araneus ventricosus]|uniref:DUF19 domain-containing protein n=1 Tax=Araneus ventricosus TaxID=182803 RepID=A0A4Y2CJT9_ARAVE|nr:hypothetical protein AVEN_75574-1 [Araneus ventricosus]